MSISRVGWCWTQALYCRLLSNDIFHLWNSPSLSKLSLADTHMKPICPACSCRASLSFWTPLVFSWNMIPDSVATKGQIMQLASLQTVRAPMGWIAGWWEARDERNRDTARFISPLTGPIPAVISPFRRVCWLNISKETMLPVNNLPCNSAFHHTALHLA